MGLNFTDSLDRRAEDIERPPLMPIGTYRWMVEKPPTIDTSGNGQWDIVAFLLKCIGPTDDVDTDELSEFTEKAGAVDTQRRRRSFMFDKTDDGAFRKTEFYLKDFIETHLAVDVKGMTLKEMLMAAQNGQCLGHIRWKPDRDNPEIMRDEIDKTAPIG